MMHKFIEPREAIKTCHMTFPNEMMDYTCHIAKMLKTCKASCVDFMSFIEYDILRKEVKQHCRYISHHRNCSSDMAISQFVCGFANIFLSPRRQHIMLLINMKLSYS